MIIFPLLLPLVLSAIWTPENDAWNMNQKREATKVEEYDVLYQGHTYFPSPQDWRFPFYTIMPDRFVDGNPSNNDIFGEIFEWDFHEVNFHHGGDMKGMESKLDYVEALGAKGIYVAGTPLLNLPWDSHYYNPYDFTQVDAHLGTLAEYRSFVNAAHARGMYVMIDLTIATGADLLYFEGFFNQSAPFSLQPDYPVHYKYNGKWTYPEFAV
jgi:alpha-1,3-glucan synthase